MIIFSKTVWVDVFHNPEPIIGLRNPCIVSMTASFVAGIVVSLMTTEKSAQERFEREKARIYLGVGAE
jgi:cation/acetate symporter